MPEDDDDTKEVNRDSGTGQFTTDEDVEADPEGTTTEVVPEDGTPDE